MLDLTFVSSPKPFAGNVAITQQNAIQSWLSHELSVDVCLMGRDAEGFLNEGNWAVRVIPDVRTTELGTPLLDDVLMQAEQLSPARTLCYINADIILMSDFAAAVQPVQDSFDRYLIVGRRRDVSINERIDFGSGDWEDGLRQIAITSGRLRRHDWIDYFVFSRGLFRGIPPFAVGRALFDNWLIWAAADRGAAVVDATDAILAIHQNHDYGHLSGGFDESRLGIEAQRNIALAGDPSQLWTIAHAGYVIRKQGGVSRARGISHLAARRPMLWRVFQTWARRLEALVLAYARGRDALPSMTKRQSVTRELVRAARYVSVGVCRRCWGDFGLAAECVGRAATLRTTEIVNRRGR